MLRDMAHVVCTPCYVMLYFSWKKREDPSHCLQIGSQITHLRGAVKSKSCHTSGPGPVFLNKFINDAWQAVYIWGCSVISQKIKLTAVSPLWKEYRKVHLKRTIKNIKINIAGVMACLLILSCWENLALFKKTLELLHQEKYMGVFMLLLTLFLPLFHINGVTPWVSPFLPVKTRVILPQSSFQPSEGSSHSCISSFQCSSATGFGGREGDFSDPKDEAHALIPTSLKNADSIVGTEEVIVCMFALWGWMLALPSATEISWRYTGLLKRWAKHGCFWLNRRGQCVGLLLPQFPKEFLMSQS